MTNEILQFPTPKVQPLDRWTWLKAISSDTGPSKWTSRLVAHTLAMHMKADLTDCFPSQPTIAKAANLSERAVRYAIEALVNEGFLLVDKVRNEGRVWCKSVYVPRLPAQGATSQQVSTPLNTTDDRHAMPVQAAQGAGTGGTPCREYRHTVPTNQTPNQSIKQSLKRISLREERILNAIQEKDRKAEAERKSEADTEVLRKKIQKAAEHLGIPVMPLGAARIEWAKDVGLLTGLPPHRVVTLSLP